MANFQLSGVAKLTLLLLGAAIYEAPLGASPPEDESVTYKIKPGDTLIDLAEKFMLSRDVYKIVQKKTVSLIRTLCRLAKRSPFRVTSWLLTWPMPVLSRYAARFYLARAKRLSVKSCAKGLPSPQGRRHLQRWCFQTVRTYLCRRTATSGSDDCGHII